MAVERSDVTNREEALAAFSAFVADERDHKSVVLPAEILEQIKMVDLPVGVLWKSVLGITYSIMTHLDWVSWSHGTVDWSVVSMANFRQLSVMPQTLGRGRRL